MTTAPRKSPTIRESLASAHANGWYPTIFAEPGSDLDGIDAPIIQHAEKRGIFHNWLGMAHWLLEQHPEATHILTMQDDALIVPNSRLLAESWQWPANAGLLSLYLRTELARKWRRRKRGVGILGNEGDAFHGSLAVIYRRETLWKIINYGGTKRWGMRLRRTSQITEDDICVGISCRDLRLRLYFTVPSCCQHIAQWSTRVSGSVVRAEWMAQDALRDCPLNLSTT